PFAGTFFRMLQAAFPFEDRPALETVLREFREDAAEIDLAIAERPETPGAIDPGLIAAIYAAAAVHIEFGILHMKHLDALMIDVDVVEVIERLQHEMRRVVEDVAARMIADPLQEHLEGDAIMQVLTGMDLVADIDTDLVIGIEDRFPAFRQFVEGGFDQARGPLRPGIEIRPGERPREGHML